MNPSLGVVTRTGLIGALGIGFPLALHMAGLSQIAQFLLPMFLPLAGGAFFLPFSAAVFIGAATPLLSALLTGMPPLAPPIAFMMMVELAIMMGVIAIVYRNVRANVWIALIAGIVADRVVLALLAAGLAETLGLPPALITWASLAAGIPGIALILLVVPPVVKRLATYSIRRPC